MRADAMTELHIGMRHNVFFDLEPEILIVPNTLAVRTNRDQAAKLFHLLKRPFQIGDSCGELRLQVNHTKSYPNTGEEFCRIKWFDDIIVGAGIQSSDHILPLCFGCQHNEITRPLRLQASYGLAHPQAVDFRHHPVQDRQWRGFRHTQRSQRLCTVARNGDLVACVPQCAVQQRKRDRIVVGDQYRTRGTLGSHPITNRLGFDFRQDTPCSVIERRKTELSGYLLIVSVESDGGSSMTIENFWVTPMSLAAAFH